MDLKPNMANFFSTPYDIFLFGRRKKIEFTTEISFCEFGIFFCQKKCLRCEKKFAMLGFRSTKNHPNRPA